MLSSTYFFLENTKTSFDFDGFGSIMVNIVNPAFFKHGHIGFGPSTM
jgi:hypothetical protein